MSGVAGIISMNIHRAGVNWTRWLLHTVIVMTAVLPSRSFSQAEHATSHIKKPLIYQIGSVVHINADGPRPLLRALDALQEKYGWMVDYEDPQYPAASTSDTNPPSFPQRRHADARNSRRENFSVEFSVGPTPDSRPDENAVLTAVADAYDQSNSAAQFELRKEKEDGGRFDFVGVEVRDQHNEMQSQQPILDLPITLTTEPRSTEETIALICQKVGEHSKIAVTPSGIGGSVNFGGRVTVTVGGIEVPARTLLSSTLAAMKGRLSWRLLYDSGGKSYELNMTGLSQ